MHHLYIESSLCNFSAAILDKEEDNLGGTVQAIIFGIKMSSIQFLHNWIKPPPPPCLSSSSSSSSEEEEEKSSDVPQQNVNDEVQTQAKSSGDESESDPDIMVVSLKLAAEAKSENTSSKQAKPLFQRVWTEEAEIALLENAVSFKADRNVDPLAHINSFYEFCRERSITGFTKRQVQEKIKRLMKRFSNNSNKGKPLVFKQDHDQKLYHLSTKIWSTQVHEPIIEELNEKKKLKTKHVSQCSVEEMVLVEGLEMIASKDKAKADGLDERWRQLRIAELELFLERNRLVHEQAQQLLEFYIEV